MTENLQIKVVEGQLVTDSRVVAEMVGKRHSDLLRDIKRYVDVISENANLRSLNFFIPSTYKTEGNNKTYECYLLTRKGCDMVANKMTGDKGIMFTATYVTKFEEMENQLKSQVVMHSYMIEDPIKRAEKWIEEHKEKLMLEQKIEEQEPMVAFADKCMKSKTLILVRQLAKLISEQGVITIGERKLYQKLRDWGLIVKGNTEPTQRAMNLGIFEVIQRTINKGEYEILSPTTKVTPKGQMYIIKRLNDELKKSTETKLLG